MIFGAIIIVAALTSTAIAIACKRTLMFSVAAIFWLIFSFWGFSASTATWDIYFITAFADIGITVAMIVEAINIWNHDRREQIKEEKKEEDILAKEKYNYERGMHPADRLRLKHGLPISDIRERRKNTTRTGW